MKSKLFTICAILFVAGIFFMAGMTDPNKDVIKYEQQLATQISLGQYPHYKLADSLYGIESRGTDGWLETASGIPIGLEGEPGNYYRLYLEDSIIILVDNLTGDSVADLTNNAQLQEIIARDNQ